MAQFGTDRLAMLAQTIAEQNASLSMPPNTGQGGGGGGGGYGLPAMQQQAFPLGGASMTPPTAQPPSGAMPTPMANPRAAEMMRRSQQPVRRDENQVGRMLRDRKLREGALGMVEKDQAEAEAKAKAEAVERADAVYKVMSEFVSPQQANAMARQAYTNPEVAQKVMEQFSGRAQGSAFQRELDYINRMPEGDKKDLALKKWLQGKQGMSIQMGADGSWTITEGASDIPIITSDVVTQRKLMEQQENLSNDIMEITGLAEGFNGDWLTYQGAIKGGFGKVMDKLGIKNPLVLDSAKRSGYMQKVKRRVLAFRKRITGVAGGEKEMKAIEESLANAEQQGQTAFMIALESELADAYKLYNSTMTKFGMKENVRDFSQSEYQIFPDDWKDAYNNKQAIEIKEGIDPEEQPTTGDPIKDALLEEFPDA